MAAHTMVFTGYCGDDCASESEQRAARGLVQGLSAMSEINPREYGQLEATVAQLEREIHETRKDVRELLSKVNKAEGGWKVFLLVGSACAAVGAIAAKMFTYFIR
jgi:hypothetical protein